MPPEYVSIGEGESLEAYRGVGAENIPLHWPENTMGPTCPNGSGPGKRRLGFPVRTATLTTEDKQL